MAEKPSSIKGRLGFTSFAVDGGFDELFEFAVKYGFQSIQIGMDSSRFFPERIDSNERKRINELREKMCLSLCFHGPSDIPLMNRHEKIRAAGLERYREMIDLAIDTGAEYFVFHPGRLAFYSVSRKSVIFMERKIPNAHIKSFRDSLINLLDYAGSRIALCMENTYALPRQFLEVLSSLARTKGLGFAWDAGHTELASPTARERVIRFFQDNISSVKIGHLHDIIDSSDHKELGTGGLNVAGYVEIFNAIGVDIILEIFPDQKLLNSLEYLKKLETAKI